MYTIESRISEEFNFEKEEEEYDKITDAENKALKLSDFYGYCIVKNDSGEILFAYYRGGSFPVDNIELGNFKSIDVGIDCWNN